MNKNEKYMKMAIKESLKALALDEVPIGCVIVKDDKVIAKAFNKRHQSNNSIAHAEIVAIQKANKKLDSWRLEDCDLYVTLEPCLMCTGAISLSRMRNVYFGAKQHKVSSYFENVGLNHYPNVVGGILENECSNILKSFFESKRRKISE